MNIVKTKLKNLSVLFKSHGISFNYRHILVAVILLAMSNYVFLYLHASTNTKKIDIPLEKNIYLIKIKDIMGFSQFPIVVNLYYPDHSLAFKDAKLISKRLIQENHEFTQFEVKLSSLDHFDFEKGIKNEFYYALPKNIKIKKKINKRSHFEIAY